MATRVVKKQSNKKEINKNAGTKNLIIVESPAKARTIKNFLGNEYEVVASKGHIRDLPKSRFGITIKDKHFVPTYSIANDHAEIVKKIQELHNNSISTYIATDEDREGEAIGYHIIEALHGKIEDFPRIVFHEITKRAIVNSLENPRIIDMNRVNAQQARRLLDRIVGFKLSGLISQKIGKGLSAGRVQSSTLKILVDKEREIREFIPKDYFLIEGKINNYSKSLNNQAKNPTSSRSTKIAKDAKLSKDSINNDVITFDLVKFADKKIEKLSLLDEEEAQNIVKSLHMENSTIGFIVSSITKKQRTTKSPPPFMTSTLQQASSNLLSFSPTRTMSIAQKLYEGVKTDQGLVGVITYMRTDSLNVAKEAIDNAREFILANFGHEYLPSKQKIYTAEQKGAQEAHEAIRPTNLAFTPEIAKIYLAPDELKLYALIFHRFIASQMKDAIFEILNIIVTGKNSEFKILGRKLLFDGFHRIVGDADKDKLLPHFRENEKIVFDEILDIKKTTEPPSHYSEAGLIKVLESLGIGRPSTYAPTMKLLVDRSYVVLENKRLVVQDIAFNVISMLESYFQEIVDSGFSAGLESKLDDIASHKLEWEDVLWDFYEPFMEKIARGKENIQSQKVVIQTGEICPSCGSNLVIRNGRYGEFTACSNYPKCKYIKRDKEDEISNEICERCSSPMQVKVGKMGKFLACSAYPKCKNTKSLQQVESLGVACPKCGGNIVARFSKRGNFYGCSSYPSCKLILNNKPTNEKCPKCGGILCLHKTKENVKVCADCKNSVS